jgi:sulfur carrier protein
MTAGIQIVVNGETREVPPGLDVAALLSHLVLPVGRVAIERNLEILPRAQWVSTSVQAGDRYEIVHMVGGGEREARNSPGLLYGSEFIFRPP